ncbi:MAG: NADH-quinone oxidoreductase subunit C [Anaerolineae bacterium]
MTLDERVLTALVTILPKVTFDMDAIAGGETVVDWPAERLLDAFRGLLACGVPVHLSAITALPAGVGTLLLYHLWMGGGLTLRVACPDNVAPSLSPLLPAASWYEREAHDMLGVRFAGHPNLKPLLLANEWDGPPPLATRETPDA